jgi:glucose uptake protein GlcU
MHDVIVQLGLADQPVVALAIFVLAICGMVAGGLYFYWFFWTNRNETTLQAVAGMTWGVGVLCLLAYLFKPRSGMLATCMLIFAIIGLGHFVWFGVWSAGSSKAFHAARNRLRLLRRS